MPYSLLLLMFRAGYRPDVAARTRAYAERAMASGNPAIDFVGIPRPTCPAVRTCRLPSIVPLPMYCFWSGKVAMM